MLPSVTYSADGQLSNVSVLLQSLEQAGEPSIFETKIVKDFYEFQWNSYAKHIHMFGCLIHFAYLIVYIAYIY